MKKIIIFILMIQSLVVMSQNKYDKDFHEADSVFTSQGIMVSQNRYDDMFCEADSVFTSQSILDNLFVNKLNDFNLDFKTIMMIRMNMLKHIDCKHLTIQGVCKNKPIRVLGITIGHKECIVYANLVFIEKKKPNGKCIWESRLVPPPPPSHPRK